MWNAFSHLVNSVCPSIFPCVSPFHVSSVPRCLSVSLLWAYWFCGAPSHSPDSSIASSSSSAHLTQLDSILLPDHFLKFHSGIKVTWSSSHFWESAVSVFYTCAHQFSFCPWIITFQPALFPTCQLSLHLFSQLCSVLGLCRPSSLLHFTFVPWELGINVPYSPAFRSRQRCYLFIYLFITQQHHMSKIMLYLIRLITEQFIPILFYFNSIRPILWHGLFDSLSFLNKQTTKMRIIITTTTPTTIKLTHSINSKASNCSNRFWGLLAA